MTDLPQINNSPRPNSMTKADFIQRIARFHRGCRIFNRLMGAICLLFILMPGVVFFTDAMRDRKDRREVGFAVWCWPAAIVHCVVWWQLFQVVEKKMRDKYRLRCPKCRNNLVPILGEESPGESDLRNQTSEMKASGDCYYCGFPLFDPKNGPGHQRHRPHDPVRHGAKSESEQRISESPQKNSRPTATPSGRQHPGETKGVNVGECVLEAQLLVEKARQKGDKLLKVDSDKLKKLTPAAVRELIHFDQWLCLRFYGWSWSDDVAVALGDFRGEHLQLELVFDLSDRAAAALSQVQGGLDLPDVECLTLAGAQSLNRVKGPLSLRGLKMLDAATVAALKNGRVWLRWTMIRPTVRQQLEGWPPANAIELPDLYE